jgi:regulatory protein
MKITAIDVQTRRPTRRNIEVDGRFALALDEALVLEHGLIVGLEVSQADLEGWRAAEEFQHLLENALNFLTFRPRSREEVRRHVQGQRVPPEMVARVLERLEQLGVLNDQAFATFWVENREEFNPRSARALGAELRQRGVERETIEASIAPERDEERALAAGRKKLRSLSAVDYATFRNRLGPFLLRRGFNYSVTNAAVRQLWEELHQQRPSEEEESL